MPDDPGDLHGNLGFHRTVSPDTTAEQNANTKAAFNMFHKTVCLRTRNVSRKSRRSRLTHYISGLTLSSLAHRRQSGGVTVVGASNTENVPHFLDD